MKKTKVMIIDDDKEFVDEFKDALTLSGYEVAVVNDPSIATSAVRKNKPDIILLDLKMPKKSGLHVAAELRQTPGFEDIPIIAMSAFYKDGTFSIMEVHGITKYLSKPMNPANVIAEIEKILCKAE